MNPTRPVRVVIRSRFWPRFLRWAVGLQIVLGLSVGFVVLMRGVNGRSLFSSGEWMGWATVSAMFAAMALGLAVRRRNVGAAEITPAGIRSFDRVELWYISYPWPLIETVRVRAGLVGNRWLLVGVTDGPTFVVTASPADPIAVLDALERFAGPEHPLTRAFTVIVEAG